MRPPSALRQMSQIIRQGEGSEWSGSGLCSDRAGCRYPAFERRNLWLLVATLGQRDRSGRQKNRQENYCWPCPILTGKPLRVGDVLTLQSVTITTQDCHVRTANAQGGQVF